MPREREARLLHPCLASVQGERALDKAESPREARRHENLVGRALDTARKGEGSGDLTSECEFSPWIGVERRSAQLGPDGLSAETGIQGGGESVRSRHAHLEAGRPSGHLSVRLQK